MKTYISAFFPLISGSPRTKRYHANPIIGDISGAVQYFGIPSDVLGHGCHCQSLQNIPSYGMPVDHKDFLCRSWSSASIVTLTRRVPALSGNIQRVWTLAELSINNLSALESIFVRDDVQSLSCAISESMWKLTTLNWQLECSRHKFYRQWIC